MTAFGILNFLAGVLELSVPSYALRLVRRFGAPQVGRFVLIAFVSLALLHLVNPLKSTPGSSLGLSLIYAVASALLLIGMGHIETLCQQRMRVQTEEQHLRLKLDLEARQKAEELVKIRQEMAQELVRLQQQVEALTVSERQYRLLFTQNPHPMWVFDLRSGRILAANESALNQYGFTRQEFTALAAKDLVAREAAQAFLSDAAKPCSSLESRGIWRHRKKDRTFVDVEIMAFDLRFGDCPARLMFAQDTAPRLRREAELCESQKMRILSRMAEGVAHHFSQILTVIEGQASLLGDGGQIGAEPLQQVLSETRRGSALIRQLLSVGGCQGIQPEAADLNALILGGESILRRLIGDQIALELKLAPGLGPVMADPRLVEHIIVNLLLNARAALSCGGTIEIHTDAFWIEHRQNQHQPNAGSGHFLCLTVRDDGCGIAPEVQEHLFEPFFTTREDDKAMGLGLATIYGAVKQQGGWIEFATEPNRGSKFSVFLPAAQLPRQTNSIQAPAQAPPARETILLVEADDRVRGLAHHILGRNGYRIIEADGPSTALLLMEGQAKDIHLLLTDANFPAGVSGRDLADQLRQTKSDLKVVYTTGTLAAEENQPALVEGGRLLLKPYTPDQLLQTIAAALA